MSRHPVHRVLTLCDVCGLAITTRGVRIESTGTAVHTTIDAHESCAPRALEALAARVGRAEGER